HPAQVPLVMIEQVLALEQHLAGRMAGRRIGQELEDRQGGHRLARAGFADQRHGLALGDVEGHAIDGKRFLASLAEEDGEVANGKERFQRRVHPQPKVLRGSKASRVASPMKISRDSISEITKKPVRPSQGARRLFWPCLSSSPSEADPGGRPKPRKSSEVSVVIEPLSMKGRKVSVATMALGRRWRNMMVRLGTPSARAAFTYSKLRARRNSARTTPTNATHENSSIRPSRMKKPGGSTAATISSK